MIICPPAAVGNVAFICAAPVAGVVLEEATVVVVVVCCATLPRLATGSWIIPDTQQNNDRKM